MLSHAHASQVVFLPRLRSFRSAELIKLGDVIEEVLRDEQSPPTQICLWGPGVDFVLSQLRLSYSQDSLIGFEFPETGKDLPESKRLIVMQRSGSSAQSSTAESCQLAPIDRDDVIDCVLARSPQRCQSVLERLQHDHFQWLWNDFEIWSRLIDELIESDDDVELCLLRLLLREIAPTYREPDSFATFRLDKFVNEYYLKSLIVPSTPDGPFAERLIRLPCLARKLEADRIADRLRARDRKCLLTHCHPVAMTYLVSQIKDDPRVVRFLRRSLKGPTISAAMTLLYCLDSSWRPLSLKAEKIQECVFPDAPWARVKWSDLSWSGCDFVQANFSDSEFQDVVWLHGQLSGVTWDRSKAQRVMITKCKANGSSWNRINWESSHFDGSTFANTDWNESQIKGCRFTGCELESSKVKRAKWQDCRVIGSTFAKSDFSDTDLSGTVFHDCRFVDCTWDRSVLCECKLQGVNFEDNVFDEVDFREALMESALLTGSRGHRLQFCRANLKNAKLAEIVWEGCDLRGANLEGVVFHFGSTRCGLVGSPYPSHGTRTGFYTDTSEELIFKEPEAVRRAALLDCDLRGANLRGVDFYLVDLRGSIMTPEQRDQAEKTGAILDS
jgi:uncharacterized protein YjbI with pentapeptide repeats